MGADKTKSDRRLGDKTKKDKQVGDKFEIIIKSIRYLFEPYSCYNVYYTKKNGERKCYQSTYIKKTQAPTPLTDEDIEFIQTHTITQIAKQFNKSTTWCYRRKGGYYYY